MKIAYKPTKDISPQAALNLHRREHWWDWYTLSDMKWRLEHSLYTATAWHGRKMVGMAMLTGDGRIEVTLAVLLVDKAYRGKGIGTALAEMVLSEVERLQPYHFGLDVFQKAAETFYRRFGFRKNAGTWLLEHEPIADQRIARIKRIRARIRGKHD